MKNLIRIMLVIISIMPVTSYGEAESTDWLKIYDKNGISGYERSLPGTEIKAFKAVTFVEARVEVIIEVLKDIRAYPLWLSKCKETKIIKKTDMNTTLFFNEINTQWSIKNRGALIKSKSSFDPETGTVTVDFKAVQDENNYRMNKGIVQITELKGRFEIEAFGREMVKITYTSMADPGGKISAVMANTESSRHPVKSLKGFRKMVKRGKYIESGMKSKEHEIMEEIHSSAPKLKKLLRKRVNEFVRDQKIIDMVFEDTALVDKIIDEKVSFKSIKVLIIDTCIKMLKDERIITANRNKSLRNILFIDKFFADVELMRLIAKDTGFIRLILNDKPVLEKLLTDRILLAKLLDNKILAKSIANDQKLVIKMLHDKDFALLITKKLPAFKTRNDFSAVVQKYVDDYRRS